ncbi:MAG: hypothetical protein ACT4P7_23445 [Gemmatimonadaceae bacterium]
MSYHRLLGALSLRASVIGPLLLAARLAAAQTDYYNLDAGRPLRVQDALVIERHAFEWQMAPLLATGAPGRGFTLTVEPEVAWGILPRTQVEVGLPLVLEPDPGAAGIDVSVLHALNAETITWPALAVSLVALLPAGPHGPSRTFTEVGVIATRTTSAGRVHVNASVTPGAVSGRIAEDLARWRVGLAGDRTWALRAVLFGAEVFVEEPLGGGGAVWSSAVGMRYQVGPRSALDVGLGRRLETGGEWFVTMGSALSFGLLHRFGGPR